MHLYCWRAGVLLTSLALTAVVVPRVCADKPKLAIVDFETLNLGAGATWGRDLAELVRQDVALRDAYEVMDGASVRLHLAENGIGIQGAYDEPGCSRLAGRANADMVLTGTLLRYGRTLRLTCTLVEPAHHAMYVCREAFFDDRPAPDEQAAREVSRIIRAACNGDRRTATTVLTEDFTGQELDKSCWVEELEKHEEYAGCEQDGTVAVQDGLLRISAEADSVEGVTSGICARVSCSRDLRDQQDYVVEAVLSGQTPQGFIAVRLAEQPTASDRAATAVTELFIRAGSEHEPLQLDRVKLRMEISGVHQSATIYSDQQDSPEKVAVDLSTFEDHWLVRFVAYTGASTFMPRGNVTMLVDNVRVVRIERGNGVHGAVVDRVTRYSLPEAVVRLQGDEWSVRTDPAGYFSLFSPPGEWTVDVQVPGYTSPEPPRARASVDLPVDVPLVRTSPYQIGDIDKVISLKNLPDGLALPGEYPSASLASDGKRLYFVLCTSDKSHRLKCCSVSVEGNDFQRVASLPISGMVGFANQRMYWGTAFPAAVYYTLEDSSLSRLFVDRDLFGIRGMAFDGTNLWCTADHAQHNVFLLIAMNPATGKVVRHVDAREYDLQGIASDGDRLWVCGERNHCGKVYEIDKKKARDEMYLCESCILNEFDGRYAALAFADGHLWGLQSERQEICRIFLGPDVPLDP